MSDPINPDYYKVGGIETIDFMQAKASHEEFAGHLRLTAIKYLSRGPYKENAVVDYGKAVWYIEKLIKHLDDGK